MAEGSGKTETGLTVVGTETAIEILKRDLLMQTYRQNPATEFHRQLNKKIVAAYEELTGVPLIPYKVTGLALKGFPGHGKTTSFKEAAKWVADKLDLNYVPNPHSAYKPQEDDFIFCTLELGGEVSNMVVKGVPFINEIEFENAAKELIRLKFADSIPPHTMQMMPHVAGSVLLFDDLPNASASIQNICLSVLEEKRYQSISLADNSYVGLTGNLGALDGTNVAKTSSALATRLKTLEIQDTVEKWKERSIAYANAQDLKDEEFNRGIHVGDAYLGEFLEQHKDLFSKPVQSKHGQPYPVPREWSKVLEVARVNLFAYMYKMQRDGRADFNFDVCQTEISGMVGIEAGSKLRTFYKTLTNDIYPTAMDLITKGATTEPRQQRLKDLSLTGGSESTVAFGLLSSTLATMTAKELINAKGDKAKENVVIGNYMKAIYDPVFEIRKDKISHSFRQFVVELDKQAPGKFTQSFPNGSSVVNMDLARQMVEFAKQQPVAQQASPGNMMVRGVERPKNVLYATLIEVVTKQESYQDLASRAEFLKDANPTPDPQPTHQPPSPGLSMA